MRLKSYFKKEKFIDKEASFDFMKYNYAKSHW